MEIRTTFAVDDIVEYWNRPARVTEVNLIEDVINRVNYFIEFVNESRKFIHLSELIELQWPYTTNILQEDIRGWEAAGETIPQQKHNRLRINSKLKHYWKKIKLYF